MRNNLAVSLSILINATLGGMRYEMLSSRCYRCGWWLAASLIDWWFSLILDEDDPRAALAAIGVERIET